MENGKKSLLEKALEIQGKPEREWKAATEKEKEEIDLALAYIDGKIYGASVVAALGVKKGSTFASSWVNGVLVKAIRRKQITLTINEEAFKKETQALD